jgi:hypothetical protein
MRPLVLTLATALAACGGTKKNTATTPTKVVGQPPGTTATPVEDPRAIADLDTGERRIEVAGGDCAAACDGVALMARARLKLCSPKTSACDDAERRENDARRNVASFCDPCPLPSAKKP